MLYTSTQVVGGHQEVTEGILGDYCDGMKFKEHPLFSVDPNALQLILYYDELELCNVLGSRRKKHKIGTFKFSCGKDFCCESNLISLETTVIPGKLVTN